MTPYNSSNNITNGGDYLPLTSQTDTTAPVITINTPVNGSTTNNSTLELNATFSETVDAWYNLNDTGNSTPVANTNNLTVTLSSLPDGAHNITVYANDSSGNLNSSILYFTVDTIPPTAPANLIHVDDAPAGYDNDNIINISWSASTDATSVIYRIYRDGIFNDSTTSTSYAFSGETEGSHTYNVSAEDSVGNINTTNASVTVILDCTAPVIHNVSLSQTSPAYGQQIIVTANVTDTNLKNVTAGSTSLTYQAGTLWNGTITAGAGANNITVTAYDYAGNSATNTSLSYNGTAATTSSSGGGSGGGTGGAGVVSSEPGENIDEYETHTNQLIAGIPSSYSFTSPDLFIYQVIVTGNENVNDVALRVEILNGQSTRIQVPPPGTVYGYANIFAGSDRINGASVKFKIENKWIEDNKIASGDIRLVKWNGIEWIILDIKENGKDDQFSYFEAQTTSFSSFAITGIKADAAPTAALPSATVIVSQVEPTSSPTAATTKSASGGGIWLAIAAICTIVCILRRKRG
ncbi:Uncharacterised protein [uncultured archaeon]|nr:Uncharacterised protein [uncultured archaeon]